MIEALKRKLGMGANAQPAEVVEALAGDAEMTEVELAAANAGDGVEGKALSYHQLVHAMSELTASFETQATELATALAALDGAQAELTGLKAASEKAAADALAAKLTARHTAITTALGTDRADAFMAATKDMPDAQFNTVMAAMTASTTVEATSTLFVEQGVDAQADVDALQAEAASNGTAAILKAKYQQPQTK